MPRINPHPCPSCEKGVVKLAKSKVCPKCRHLAFKARQDEIIQVTKRRKEANGEPTSSLPRMP